MTNFWNNGFPGGGIQFEYLNAVLGASLMSCLGEGVKSWGVYILDPD